MPVLSVSALSAVAIFRFSVGLAQGVLLYVLVKFFVGIERHIFATVLLPLLLVPLLAVQAATHLKARTLALWTAATVILCAGLGFYAVWRDPNVTTEIADSIALLGVFLSVGLFIAQALIVAAAANGKRIASYATYFDIAWKQGVQAAASVGFVGAFWLLLLLGAALFKLIGLKFFGDIIEQQWFAFPATTLALSTAIHVTDVRPGIVRGIRTLALTLLSWLLPILAVIVAGFVISLPFTGLQKLWDTNFATALVLVVMAALVILINAAYQDGTPDNAAPAVTRHSATVSAVLLVPLVLIAGYGLSLRVGQYGWTTDRLIAAACVLVAACYAGGYAWAVATRGDWLKRLEVANIATSFAVLAVLFALFTPIADPSRIAVNSQMARLADGKIQPEKFDYKYLRFDAGRYGVAALERLKDGAVQIADAQQRADQALQLKAPGSTDTPITPDLVAGNITVLTAGRTLPDGFARQNWDEAATQNREWDYPACLRSVMERCDALILDLNADGVDEVVLIPPTYGTQPGVFQRDESGRWHLAAHIGTVLTCEGLRADLRDGRVQSQPSRWHDLQVGQNRFSLDDVRQTNHRCPSDD